MQAVSRLDDVFDGFPITLKIAQVGQLLGMDSQTVYRHLRAGRLPGYKIGGSWVIYRDELKDFLTSERRDRLAVLGAEAPSRTPDAPALDSPATRRQQEKGESEPEGVAGEAQDAPLHGPG